MKSFFFNDVNGTRPYDGTGVDNPSLLVIAAVFEGGNVDPGLDGGEGTVELGPNSVAMVLKCTVTALDFTYQRLANGSQSEAASFTSTVSNASVANAIISTFKSNDSEIGASPNQRLRNAANQAIFGNRDMFSDAMTLFGNSVSEIGLGLAFGAFEARSASVVQQGDQTIATSFPKALFWCLVACDLLWAAAAVVLTAIALTVNAKNSSAKEVKDRLSTTALVADRFEGDSARMPVGVMRNLFAEHQGLEGFDHRIGIRRNTFGGYEFFQNGGQLRRLVRPESFGATSVSGVTLNA
jgi:hypothetical protein